MYGGGLDGEVEEAIAIDDLDLNLESQTGSQTSFRPTAAKSLSLPGHTKLGSRLLLALRLAHLSTCLACWSAALCVETSVLVRRAHCCLDVSVAILNLNYFEV